MTLVLSFCQKWRSVRKNVKVNAFYKSHLKAAPGWNWLKIKLKQRNTLRLNFFKSIPFDHPRYHPKILKKNQKCAKVNFNRIMWLIKVARVVNLKLAFTERFFYNLIILIKLCKTPYLHLDNALLFPRNQLNCLKIENSDEL